MNKIYVVTNYYNNSESWGDSYHDEKPVKVFSNLASAKAYCESMGREIESIALYNHQVAKYGVTKEYEYMQCPTDQNWRECEEDYDEDYCDGCYRRNSDIFYDRSFEELRIYEIEMGN